ncbi:MAG: prolipoprotein diacylglyceryl transferase [Bdellovibrionaceae bacterium]|nr:prolipoprotein diacylglyceryl transferase [Pseudobdellovibrionaceae bacterium]
MTYYHQLDPFLIHFYGNFGIRWYSMAYILAVLFAYFAGQYLIKKNRIQIPSNKLMDIVVFGAIGAVVGGRLGYCLFYSPDLFLSFDSSFPFWGILKVHQGGMSSHGGIIGLLFSLIFYSYRYKMSFFSLMDLGAFAGAFGIFFGRIANFINGELYGRIAEGSAWLTVRFPSEVLLWASQADIYKKQLISLKEITPKLDTMLLKIPSPEVWMDWVNKAVIAPDSVYSSYVSYACQLILQSAYKSPIKEMLEPLLSLRYPSQLYQAIFGGLFPLILMSLFWIKSRKAGFISLVFIISYLSFRIFTEFYREPDYYIGFQLFDLTRGQWLSILFYSIVCIYAYFFYKKKPEKE